MNAVEMKKVICTTIADIAAATGVALLAESRAR